jgi:hypothetical protein
MFKCWSRHTIPDAAHSPGVLSHCDERCSTRSRKILQFKHYTTDAPI